MNKTVPPFAVVIRNYLPILERYARILLKNERHAAAVVKEVFEQLYEEDAFSQPDTLRVQIISRTRQLCTLWQQIHLTNASNN